MHISLAREKLTKSFYAISFFDYSNGDLNILHISNISTFLYVNRKIFLALLRNNIIFDSIFDIKR